MKVTSLRQILVLPLIALCAPALVSAQDFAAIEQELDSSYGRIAFPAQEEPVQQYILQWTPQTSGPGVVDLKGLRAEAIYYSVGLGEGTIPNDLDDPVSGFWQAGEAVPSLAFDVTAGETYTVSLWLQRVGLPVAAQMVARVETDADEDGLWDALEEHISAASSTDDLEQIGDVLPGDDFDNDGVTNLEEQTVGFDPVIPNGKDEEDLIPDPILRVNVAAALGAGVPLNTETLADLIALHVVRPPEPPILGGSRSPDPDPMLTGLEHASNLEVLTVEGYEVHADAIKRFPRLLELGVELDDYTDLAQLSRLEVLTITQDFLNEDEYETIGTLAGLRELNLVHMNLSTAAPLVSLTQLTRLDLSENNITDAKPLSALVNLEELYLGGKDVPQQFDRYGALRWRSHYSRSNDIDDLSFVTSLQQLRRLDIGANPVADLSPLTELPNLEWLDTRYSGADWYGFEDSELYQTLSENGVEIVSARDAEFPLEGDIEVTETPWYGFTDHGNGSVDSSERATPGIGWINVKLFPWVYAYGLGGEWIYTHEDQPDQRLSLNPNDFYAYRPSQQTWIWANANWGWYYQFSGSDAGWHEFQR